MRETNLEMLKTIKEKEHPDVVLVGGDTISNNGGQPWDEATYQKVVSQLTAALEDVSDTVLYVNGNHDYEAVSYTHLDVYKRQSSHTGVIFLSPQIGYGPPAQMGRRALAMLK